MGLIECKGMVRINFSCKSLMRRLRRLELGTPKFGCLLRPIGARGLMPSVRVRSLHAGEGRPWRGVQIMALLLFSTPALAAGDLPEDWATFHDARVELHSGLTEEQDERWLVMRYIAPQIARQGGTLGYEDVSMGMDAICDGPGLAAVRAHESPVDQIVITVMDRVVERGQPSPEATQFISTYAVTEAGCEWQ